MILQNFKNGYDVTKGSAIATHEKNDCAVRACANAFNITYDVAHAFAAKAFHRKPKQATYGMFEILGLLGNVAFEMYSNTLFPENKSYDLVAINNPINTDYTHKKVAYTVKTFCSRFARGTYIVNVNKHALVVKDGIVVDNADMQFTGYRRTIKSYVKVK
tara:strand:- start:5 stop:484 length:480 start_codon:yes stop_codon:yes gene_type:complete